MSPHKQPKTLFKICVKSSMSLINSACYVIEKSYPENKFYECERHAYYLNRYLTSMLPVRLFDVLSSKRKRYKYRGDPRIQFHVLTHPNMTVFRKCDIDNSIPEWFWTDVLPKFSRLIVLDLKFICTDEILHVIGASCPLLEEINIVSRIDISKACLSCPNSRIFSRNVSDVGLQSIANLKNLRILAMDRPGFFNKGNSGSRYVSQMGMITLITQLPYLEDLQIESCDVGSTLISSVIDIGPLSLRKINCHFGSADGTKKLIKMCPFLNDLSIINLNERNKDAILDHISSSDLRLQRLKLSFFSYSESMMQFFMAKGSYLTHFSLFENSWNFEALLSLGVSCPNLTYLCLMTHSRYLVLPRYFRRPSNIFTELRNLTIGYEYFNIDDMLNFFLECTNKLQKLVVKYQSKVNIDNTLVRLLENGSLNYVNYLWLDCTLEVSKNVLMQLIRRCEKLQTVTVDLTEDNTDVLRYIYDNNLDLKLGSY